MCVCGLSSEVWGSPGDHECPLLHQGICAIFCCWNFLVVPYLTDFYMHLFQTFMMVLYAWLGKTKQNIIRPNHICVLLATGVLGDEPPISSCPSPTHLRPQPPSGSLPLLCDIPWHFTFFHLLFFGPCSHLTKTKTYSWFFISTDWNTLMCL